MRHCFYQVSLFNLWYHFLRGIEKLTICSQSLSIPQVVTSRQLYLSPSILCAFWALLLLIVLLPCLSVGSIHFPYPCWVSPQKSFLKWSAVISLYSKTKVASITHFTVQYCQQLSISILIIHPPSSTPVREETSNYITAMIHGEAVSVYQLFWTYV